MDHEDLSKYTRTLLLQQPFFGHLLLKVNRVITDKIPTACVSIDRDNLQYQLSVNPEFFMGLASNEERVAVLHHEVMHLAYLHLEMASNYADPQIANYAMDAEINQYIKNLPKGCVDIFESPLKELNLKEREGSRYYYAAIRDKSESDQDFKDQLQKAMGGASDHSQWEQDPGDELTEEEQEILKVSVEDGMKEAYENLSSQQKGNLPGGLSKAIEKLFEKKEQVFNWKAYFRRFIGTLIDIERKKTLKRESKRFPGMPGMRTKKKVQVFVSVDTSGSMGSKDIADVFEQINYIIKNGATVRVVTWDTQIHDDFMYDGKRLPVVHGGGGSDITPVIDLYNKQQRDYVAAIHLTDGYIGCSSELLGENMFVITAGGTTDLNFVKPHTKILQISENNFKQK